jgi:hypothetical protein
LGLCKFLTRKKIQLKTNTEGITNKLAECKDTKIAKTIPYRLQQVIWTVNEALDSI